MLGLATHEPNFTIIREEFKPNKPRPCALCGQIGHEIKDCQGTAREKQGEVRSSACFCRSDCCIITIIICVHLYTEGDTWKCITSLVNFLMYTNILAGISRFNTRANCENGIFYTVFQLQGKRRKMKCNWDWTFSKFWDFYTQLSSFIVSGPQKFRFR